MSWTINTQPLLRRGLPMSGARRWETKTATTKEQREHCPGKHPIIRQPRSRKEMARAAPRMTNTPTARARTIPRQMGQAEARQSQTRITCQTKIIPGTSILKTRSGASISTKEKAKTATMYAYVERSQASSRRNCKQSLGRNTFHQS